MDDKATLGPNQDVETEQRFLSRFQTVHYLTIPYCPWHRAFENFRPAPTWTAPVNLRGNRRNQPVIRLRRIVRRVQLLRLIIHMIVDHELFGNLTHSLFNPRLVPVFGPVAVALRHVVEKPNRPGARR